MNDERMQILKRIEAGELSAEEAVRQINALGQAPSVQAGPGPKTVRPELEPDTAKAASAPPMDVPKGLAHFWLYPLWVGVATIVVGALLLYAVYGASASVWLSLCGWPVFAAGVLVAATAWWLRTARWVHVRVTGKERVAISLPLPLKLTAWVFKIARPFVPQLRDTGLDEVIMSLGDTLGEDGQPLYVDVNDDETGEHVQVYIG
jgi:SHOCT-like domain